jgi:hypothetical protein
MFFFLSRGVKWLVGYPFGAHVAQEKGVAQATLTENCLGTDVALLN